MGLREPVNASVRVAIISRSARERECLGEIVVENGLRLVDDETFRHSLNGELNTIADIVLVNLDDQDDAELDALIDKVDLPLLFNDSATIRKQVTAGGRAWGRRLAEKLIEASGQEVMFEENAVIEEPTTHISLVREDIPATVEIDLPDLNLDFEEPISLLDIDNDEPVVPYKDMPTEEIVAMNVDGRLSHVINRAREIWVLGASIGGPQAVKEFIARLPKDLPVCFILAQHIGVGFVSLLAEQLSRVTSLKVTTPEDGMVMEKGHLVVAPVDQRINFSERGIVSLEAISHRSIYSPSIDDVMTVVAKHYGADANAIIFSGMGNDGTAGCQIIAGHGGKVWAQEPQSCVISSMSDSVRYEDIVDYSGTPEELADKLIEHLKK